MQFPHPLTRFSRPRAILFVFVWIVLIACLCRARLQAQVPDEYASLYQTTQTELTNFAATVDAGWDGSKPPVQFCGELYPATSVSAPPAAFFQTTILPYIDALQALGVRTVKMSINFPVLYAPYYQSSVGANNAAGYQQTLSFYQAVVAALRQRGMKIIIPTQVVFPYEYSTTTPYFQSLTLAQYSAARSAMAQTIATELQPDYLIVQSEPVTEVGNLPSNLATPLGDTATDLNMVAGILNDLQNAGLRSETLLVGAGMGTWQPDFGTFLSGFVALPMDLLDVHVYPINDRVVNGETQDYLGRILQMADAAHAAGMKVGMGECWPYKETDAELSVNTSDQIIPSRDVYSFWGPLDTLFLQTIAEAGYWKQFEFIDPFWSLYYFAYLDFDQMQPLISGQTPDAAAAILEQQENKAAYTAIENGDTTGTGTFFAAIVAGTIPAAHTPVIASAPIVTASANQAFAYQITASDAPTNFGAAGMPPGLSVDTASGLISGTPLSAGSFAIALSATNASGTGMAGLTVNVTAASSPTPTPTPVPTPTPSPSPTPAPSPTATPPATPAPTPTPTVTPAPTPGGTPTPVPSPTPSLLPVVTINATVAQTSDGSAVPGQFVVARSGTVLAALIPLKVAYKVKGSAPPWHRLRGVIRPRENPRG